MGTFLFLKVVGLLKKAKSTVTMTISSDDQEGQQNYPLPLSTFTSSAVEKKNSQQCLPHISLTEPEAVCSKGLLPFVYHFKKNLPKPWFKVENGTLVHC